MYLKVLSLQDNYAARLETGLEALKRIDPNYTVRSEIALQTAETALRLGNDACAAVAAVIGEIQKADGRTPSKNDYLLNWKQAYSGRTAYHRELRNFGLMDGK